MRYFSLSGTASREKTGSRSSLTGVQLGTSSGLVSCKMVFCSIRSVQSRSWAEGLSSSKPEKFGKVTQSSIKHEKNQRVYRDTRGK